MRRHVPEKWRSYVGSYTYRLLSYIRVPHKSQSGSGSSGAIIPRHGQSNGRYQNLENKGQDDLAAKQGFHDGGHEPLKPYGSRGYDSQTDGDWLPMTDV